MTTEFIFCSAYIGQQSIGTPAVIASITEFHPQCVTKAPVALWLSTSTCGAHSFTTRPRALVLSKNPGGRSAWRSESARGSNRGPVSTPPVGRGARTTHRNRCPDLSRPTAISLSCSAEWVAEPKLPKQRNTTLRSGCSSSHARHSCFSFVSPSPAATINGPTQYTGGVLMHPPSLSLSPSPMGRNSGSLRALSTRASSDANVFTKMPSGSGFRRITRIIVLYDSLAGSWSIDGMRYDAGMGGTPVTLRRVSPSSLKLGWPWPSAWVHGSCRNTATAEALVA
ncbi:hypothetical protein BDA96_02G353400 [Sorghum bicolor]|uniref:Uncharacterized protein n=1 Tax=Sorghum bicolor TaxID=4558 RepID=A0A921RSL2_SORBI|nr:hypothetical protein BDA96_02G353400 [Sorghum bicolor]